MPADDGYKWKAFAAIGLFFVTAVLAFSMVFVALPAIAEEFEVTLRAASWVVIAHILAISALLLPMGRLADLIGRRRIHLIGLGFFAAGALMVAVAPSFEAVIAARVVMAIGDAMSQSVSTGILVSVFPQHERGKAIGSQTTSVAVGAAVGPILAGLILQFLSWRALFALLAIPTLVAFVVGYSILDEERVTGPRPERQPFDWGGAVLSAAAITLLALVINDPLSLGWASPLLLSFGVVAVALFVTFARWELRSPAPMLELRLFAHPVFAAGVAARIVGFMAATAVYILVPVLLISLIGFSESRAGIVLFLNSIGLGTGAQIAGRLSDRWGTKPFMIAGFVAMIGTSLAFASMDRSTSLGAIALTSLVGGMAIGTWNVPNNATIIGTVGSASYGVVGAFTNLARNVGNVFGQALVAAVVAGIMAARGFDVPLSEIGDSVQSGDAFVAGWRAAFLAMAGLSAVGLVLVALIRPGAEPDHDRSLAGARRSRSRESRG